ncbi:MAG: hypothetical protein ACLT32_04685 [Ruminococcus bicirculans (ex Wegman et al. 2014)]|uniref:Transposase n=1 Tax=Ruminococcus bicirculans (ex Wegman et al. 2014) TaxID=1160721 RepID=A0AAW6DZU3_9FIRM|nr:hypothetical protein [Ruminococcus bicirculans (ex Wegman et al. 2014)]MDB8735634.1 hypothetical protein [Ruminococcus bicirculans (ex Wegman et al. 2014)]MDB8741797.1 hypothetical protein [Ruminococcus bicirculans (ex Wegman et al. 2014)]
MFHSETLSALDSFAIEVCYLRIKRRHHSKLMWWKLLLTIKPTV